ncbi:MAG: ATP-binding protein [Marmoricola sp.]
MDTLPSGTVTMVFTDIDGSTALLSRLGDRYAGVLSAHRALLREAFERWSGHEMGTQGDSFFVVFESARAAVLACLDAQRSLASHDWPEGAVVRVRMGLHTGELSRHEDDYVGMDVHRGARIAAAAHGGQIVLSDVTKRLVATCLPDDVELRDVGWHRFKDLAAPERVHELLAPGVRADSPPLKSLGAPTKLPVPPTPLVGRDRELGQVRNCLLEPDGRLVTLTGPGGSGKTRLAIAVAASLDRDFSSGVFFVPLAAARDADVMWDTIADALGVAREGATAEAVVEHLSGCHALLVLDNLEQLSEASQVIQNLLAGAPKLSVLAASRRPLHLQGEHEHPVPPLTLPKDPGAGADEVAASGAVRLFVQQATMVRPGFTLTDDQAADVAAICTRLDGLPLAIELAASRVRLLAPRALLARLDHSLGLGAGGAGRPARQQTLRDTIAWSYNLLPVHLQAVFRRAGVFVGGCELKAFAAVVGVDGSAEADALDLVADLVDASLLTIGEDVDGEPRVTMLETIREFCLERLTEASELDDVRRLHAERYVQFAQHAASQLHGTQQVTWLDRLEAEHDNLRASLSWSLEPAAGDHDRVTLALRLVNALSWFWYGHGHAVEGRRWFERAIAMVDRDDGPDVATAMHGLGVLMLQQAEAEAARAVLEHSLAMWRHLEDRDRVAMELSSLAVAHRMLGETDTARSLLQESIDLCRALGNDARLATALTNLGCVEIDSGEPERAMVALGEALVIDRRTDDSWAVAVDEGNLAAALLHGGRAEAARELLCSVIYNVVGLRDIELVADTLEHFAAVVAALGARLRAASLAGAAQGIRDKAGMPISAPDAALLERTLGPAREAVGPEAWEQEWAAGRRLSQDEAVALAVLPIGVDDASPVDRARGEVAEKALPRP